MSSRRPVGGQFLIPDSPAGRSFVPEDLTPEDRSMGRTASEFLRKEVLPHVARIEAGDHDLMRDLMKKAGALGLLAVDIPEVYGGLGRSQATGAFIAEQLNWQQSFALTHEAHTVIGTLPLLFFGNHAQKLRYLPRLASGEWIASFALSEADSGSDALAAQTRATLTPDGRSYLLNGVKTWITNTAFADLFTVFGKTEDDKFTAFLVERSYPGVSFGKEEHKLGMHGTSTRRLILENVPVPVENALVPGEGQYAAFCALNMGRFKLEAGAVGGLKETLRVCTAYAAQRRAFGKALREFGMIRHKLAEMAARTFALESMVYRLAGDLDELFAELPPDAADASHRYHKASEELALECNLVKVIGSETYSRMTDEAIQIHGGYGYTEEFPVARAWRDQRLLRIGEGANEVVRLAIVSLLLRRDREKRLDVLRAAADIATSVDCAGVENVGVGDGLEGIATAATAIADLALYALHHALQRWGNDLMEMQEVVGAIADTICAAYAVQCIAVRCGRLRGDYEARFGPALVVARVAARDYADEALGATRFALDAIRDGSEWRGENGITGRLKLLERLDVSPVTLRRELAALVCEREGYPL